MIEQARGTASQTGVQIGANETIAGSTIAQTGALKASANVTTGVQVGVSAGSTAGIYVNKKVLPYYIPPANFHFHFLAAHKEFLDSQGFARVSTYQPDLNYSKAENCGGFITIMTIEYVFEGIWTACSGNFILKKKNKY